MKVKELVEYLNSLDGELEVKLLPNHHQDMVELEMDHLYHTSEGAYVDEDFPEDEWDTEDGKIVHKGSRFLLINPIII